MRIWKRNVLFVVLLSAAGCGDSQKSQSSHAEYMKYLSEGTRLQEEMARQLKESGRQIEAQDERGKRMDALISTWETIAQRMNSTSVKWERVIDDMDKKANGKKD